FSSRRRHTRFSRDWSSDVCSSDLLGFREHLLRALDRALTLGLAVLHVSDLPKVVTIGLDRRAVREGDTINVLYTTIVDLGDLGWLPIATEHLITFNQ